MALTLMPVRSSFPYPPEFRSAKGHHAVWGTAVDGWSGAEYCESRLWEMKWSDEAFVYSWFIV